MSNTLSSRVRPDVEAAPWVIDAIKTLEAELAAAQESRDNWRMLHGEVAKIAEIANDNCNSLAETIRKAREQKPIGIVLSEEQMGISYDRKAGEVIWIGKPAQDNIYALPPIPPAQKEGWMLRWAKYIVQNQGLPDHACAECVPYSDILISGFRCAYHQAKAILAAAPQPEGESHE